MKFFGTDGIRGKYDGGVINCNFAHCLGIALGKYLLAKGKQQAQVLIGRDTRPSGDSLTAALISGLIAQGCYPKNLGVIPTPCLCFNVMRMHADLGVMITASHNPCTDNGLSLIHI